MKSIVPGSENMTKADMLPASTELVFQSGSQIPKEEHLKFTNYRMVVAT